MIARRTLPFPPADPITAPAVTRAPLATLLEPLLSVRDLAELLRTSRRSIERMRSGGRLPPPDMHLTVRQPRWRAQTIRDWIDQQSHK
jgi:predicted DNA-binding transcriptional regulator AlpA